MCLLDYFLLFKRKTAYEMRISDWSSDVCSSDLDEVLVAVVVGGQTGVDRVADVAHAQLQAVAGFRLQVRVGDRGVAEHHVGESDEIGRASCRDSVCQYV